MAHRYPGTAAGKLRHPKPTIISNNNNNNNGGSSIVPFRKLIRRSRSPESTQLMGLMVLLISTGILLMLTGITFTTMVVTIIFLVPVIILSSPIWVPTGIVLFFVTAVALLFSGVGLAAAMLLLLFRPIRK
uniref:oleosin-like n=1 Tax=Erigeron canadensis TaxID=72917 RepID=UPI001CB8920C|nr:oleosin-like [Erigeron canadensis]